MAQQQKASGGIRILSVVWYKVLPARFGGQKGVALFNEYLGRLAPLHCLCSKDNVVEQTSYSVDASLPVGKSQFFNPFCWRKIYKAAKRFRATHLILEFPYHGIAGMFCKKRLGVKLIVHSHNIESLRFREQKKNLWKALHHLEKWTLRHADLIFFKTEKDRSFALRNFYLDKNKTAIAPYGVVRKPIVSKQAAKDEMFKRHNILPETKLLLFAGTLDYGPNADAFVGLKNNLVPLLNKTGLDYKIVVCGRIVFESFAYLRKTQNDRLLYVGDVEDVEIYFAAADVFLAPVFAGGGVQTKAVEAVSFGLNTVCFAGMNEGITGAEAKIFSVPKHNWQAFTDATLKALRSETPTPAAFFENHNWQNTAAKAYVFLQTT